MNAIYQIDSVLNFIATTDFSITGNPARSIHHELERRKKIEIGLPEFFKILDKLVKDEYLKATLSHEGTAQYELTYDGKVFNQNGGYTEKSRRESIRANLQFWQTWAIVIGTLFAGLYGLYEILKAVCR